METRNKQCAALTNFLNIRQKLPPDHHLKYRELPYVMQKVKHVISIYFLKNDECEGSSSKMRGGKTIRYLITRWKVRFIMVKPGTRSPQQQLAHRGSCFCAESL